MTIYFLSGLGADSRIFKKLVFPENTKVVFIDWVSPQKNESIQEYAKKLSAKIDTTEPFILAGLSFGGMIATEMNEYVKPLKTILISSAGSRNELLSLYKLAGMLHLDWFLPGKKIMYHPALVPYQRLGAISVEDKLLVDELHAAADYNFSRWAINAIIHWKRSKPAGNIVRIHGTNDQILPVINFKPDYLIQDGGHLMVVNKAAEISKILAAEIGEQ